MSAPQSPPSPQKFVRCPGCREQLGVRPEDVGRRARCSKCGKVFLIGGGSSDVPVSANDAGSPLGPVAALPPEPDEPAIVTFECSLCQTRMSARTADVGRMVACPDCGRRNKIPPPPKRKAAKPPAALSGEQFDLWGVDDTPWLGASEQPTLIPVECRVCQTLMYATEAQVGGELKCPDCGAATKVVRPKPKKPGGIVPVLAGEEYDLDPESAPAPRPTAVLPALIEAQKHHAPQDDTAPRPKRREEFPAHEQPPMPAVPLVRGVLRMLLTGEVLARWMLLSLWASAVAWLGMQITAAGGGGMGGIMAVCFFALACILGMLWLTCAAPLWLSLIVESSEGHDGIQDPPSWSSFDWFGETLHVIVPAAGSAIPAWLVTKGAALAWRAIDPATAAFTYANTWTVALGVAAWLAIFPVALLSSLDQGSPLDVFSRRIMGSLARCLGPWLLFYLVSSTWLAAFGFAGYFAIQRPFALGTVAILAVAATLVYMRLLGRLAWWLAESLPGEEMAPAVDHSAAAHPHLAAERRAALDERHEK